MAHPPFAAAESLSDVIQLGPLAIARAALRPARRMRSLPAGARSPAGVRRASTGGLLVIAAALTGLGTPSEELLYAHMIEHLLLGDIAALLIVLGLTGPLLAPILRIGFFDRLRALSHPRSPSRCGPSTSTSGTCPPSTRPRCATPAVHALEHAMFLGLGINMWMCLFGPLPMPQWFGNLGTAALHRRGAPDRRPCSATSSSGRAPSSTPSTCAATPSFTSRRSPIRTSPGRS